jgi:flagellar biosynthesis protein FlhG
MRVVARRFLRLDLDCLGVIPYDASVPRAVRLQEPVVSAFPKSPAAAAYQAIAAQLWKPIPRSPESVDVPELSHRLEA